MGRLLFPSAKQTLDQPCRWQGVAMRFLIAYGSGVSAAYRSTLTRSVIQP